MMCRDVEKLLSELADGELRPDQSERVQEHLEVCSRCASEWRALRSTLRLVAHLGRERCPVDLRERVMQAVVGIPQERRSPVRAALAAARDRVLTPGAGVFAGGAAVVAVALSLAQLQTPRGPSLPARLPAPGPAIAESHLHVQYDLANALGVADGVMLSLSQSANAPAERGRRSRARTLEKPPLP